MKKGPVPDVAEKTAAKPSKLKKFFRCLGKVVFFIFLFFAGYAFCLISLFSGTKGVLIDNEKFVAHFVFKTDTDKEVNQRVDACLELYLASLLDCLRQGSKQKRLDSVKILGDLISAAIIINDLRHRGNPEREDEHPPKKPLPKPGISM